VWWISPWGSSSSSLDSVADRWLIIESSGGGRILFRLFRPGIANRLATDSLSWLFWIDWDNMFTYLLGLPLLEVMRGLEIIWPYS